MPQPSRPILIAVFVVATAWASLVFLSGAGASAAPGPLSPGPLPPTPVSPRVPRREPGEAAATAVDRALVRLQPTLRALARAGGDQEVPVAVEARPGARPGRLMLRSFTRPPIDGEPETTFGYVKASGLLKLAALPDVRTVRLQVFAQDYVPPPADPDTFQAPSRDARKLRISHLKSQISKVEPFNLEPATLSWFDAGPGHRSSAAWAKGFRGQGVRIAVQDDGIDFAHPDLMGTYATVPPTTTLPTGVYTSPYAGWPIAFDPFSMFLYAHDVYFGTDYVARGETRYVDTSATPSVSRNSQDQQRGLARFEYTPLGVQAATGLKYEYVFRDTSRSGVYHVGSHPDKTLLDTFGERVAVLLVDEHVAGVYDTVYVDLDGDHDFTNEQPVTRDDPVARRDLDGDGYADISGGLLYYIADGVHPIPVSDWLYGIGLPGYGAVPANGSLIAFTGALDLGYSHGTQAASNVVGQGRLTTYAPAFRDLPGDHPPGMVVGAAPEARLVDTSNIFYNYLQSRKDAILFAALGYDGVRNSGDEVQIASESHGQAEADNDGWTDYSRYIDHEVRLSPSLSVVLAAGNGGPGYGTLPDHDPVMAIEAGASTEFGSTGWDSITSTGQILFGDVSWFSNRGPGARGTAGPHILANGDRGPGAHAINFAGFNGRGAWSTWGGTSRSAPVVAGNLALVYQAFRQRTGRWPTWQEARAILTSSARDVAHDVFSQGAGIVDADRATDTAAGLYGVYVTPDNWRPGDYRGHLYPSFANTLKPGAIATQTFTLTNPGPQPVAVSLAAQTLRRIGSRTFNLTTAPLEQESTWNLFAPDYLIPIDPAIIPAETRLMVVRMHFPYAEFDPNGDFTVDSRWYLYVYDWTDINQDGQLWIDRDGNGVVNHLDGSTTIYPDGISELDWNRSEIERWEYERFAYARPTANSATLTIRDPLQRMHSGLFLGLQHRERSTAVPVTHFTFQLDFYAPETWQLLAVPNEPIPVPAGGTATFQATVRIPAGQPPGLYEGAIYIQQPVDPARISRVYLPLVASAFTHGGAPPVPPTRVGFSSGSLLAHPTSPPNPPILGGTPTSAGDSPPISANLRASGGSPSQAASPVPPNFWGETLPRALTPPSVGGPGGPPTAPREDAVLKFALMDSPPPHPPKFGGRGGWAGEADWETERRVPNNVPLRGPGGPPAALPVVLNVAPDLTTPLQFGGAAASDTGSLYDNGSIRGAFDWDWRVEAGDWRQFFLDVPTAPPPDHLQRLVTWNRWDDSPPTDLDTIILGPASDRFSDPTHPENQAESYADPEFYGPYTLDVVARSKRTDFTCSGGQGGCWRFDTVTGGPDEWVTAPITAGLHSVLLHAVNFRGDRFQVPFTTTVASFDVTPAPMSLTIPSTHTQTISGTAVMTFTTGITLPDLAVTAYGLSQPESLPAQPIAQDNPYDPTTASYTRDFTLTHAARLFVGIDPGLNDVDLYLLRDIDGDGRFQFPDERIASSTAPAGQPDSITLRHPPDGRYYLLVHGYDVTPSPGTFNLQIEAVQGLDLRVTGIPAGSIPARQPVQFAVEYKKVIQNGEKWQGEILLGPSVAPDVLSIPLTLSVGRP